MLIDIPQLSIIFDAANTPDTEKLNHPSSPRVLFCTQQKSNLLFATILAIYFLRLMLAVLSPHQLFYSQSRSLHQATKRPRTSGSPLASDTTTSASC
jgi:hypothetical protein